LQKINTNVFKTPENIDSNISLITNFMEKNNPFYFFVSPIKTKNGSTMFYDALLGYYRVFPFVKNSVCLNVVKTPEQAYEAAKQFGKFTNALNLFPTEQLKTTLPAFHDLDLRYQLFKDSLVTGNKERIAFASTLIQQIEEGKYIVTKYKHFKKSGILKQRVTHHDTKISNVLFDVNNKGICIIDLDTVMPGYFISDVGDMMRTYLSPVNEEEMDFSKIEIRKNYYDAIVDGYLSEMQNSLSIEEKNNFSFAGLFMIYMQALRFLTDYINMDIYYGAKYDLHNFNRAKNQIILLQKYEELIS
jgi:Ser/Thr protein kinase RdoA (MazF antagonist)